MKYQLRLGSDKATQELLIPNILTIAAALWQGWSVLQLLWPYWMQSVIIGIFARRRILALKDFCVEGFKINDRPVPANPQTLRTTAFFFAIHYGFFHLIYFFFLMTFTFTANPEGLVEMTNSDTGQITLVRFGQLHPIDFLFFIGIAISFWFSHKVSASEHVEADLARKPNIGTLMFLPYARIIPMHLTIIFGSLLGGGRIAVLLFALLKTGADLLMHNVEHYWLQGSKQRPQL